MLVVFLLRLDAIILACPKPNGTGYDDTAINKRKTADRVTVGINFFGVKINFRYGVHLFGTLCLLRVIESEVNRIAGLPTEFAQHRERIFEPKLRRIPLRLRHDVRNRLTRTTMAEQLGELAETLATADRFNADDQSPKVSKQHAHNRQFCECA